jgi:alcohol dehydrogenase class IV
MVKPFRFASLPEIIFRNGGLDQLPALIKLYGRDVILVTGKQSFAGSQKADSLFQKLNDEGVKFQAVKISGEPSPEDIDINVRHLSNERFDCVIGIGGGSVLDAGKAISAMMYKEESIADYLESVGSMDHPGTKLPYIAVPTTSGTGSEATKNAVISRVGKDGFKRSLRHDKIVPDIALIDPELTLNCPADITAASGMDCFTQLIESYLSEKSSPYTDALALEGLKAVKGSLVRCVRNGSNIEARSGMSLAALTSGICIANAGLGVVHGFASSVGGRYNIPHGIVCGTLMASANELTVRKLRETAPDNPALEKYALMGKLFLDKEGTTEDFLIDAFIDYLRNLTNELHLQRLGEAGVNQEDLVIIAKNTECKNNPVKLTSEELLEILELSS